MMMMMIIIIMTMMTIMVIIMVVVVVVMMMMMMICECTIFGTEHLGAILHLFISLCYKFFSFRGKLLMAK